MTKQLEESLFKSTPNVKEGVYIQSEGSGQENQDQTNDAFSEKWKSVKQAEKDSKDNWKLMQFEWYPKLYGYDSETELRNMLQSNKVILDAGCGLGYKAAWFADLAPESLIVCMDFSDAIFEAVQRYGDYENMIFVKGDIANTGFADGVFDMISCDQVLHHTESPPSTLREFNRITKGTGILNTYVYAKKALPRELLDDHFREASKELSHEEIWELSEQLTKLGKVLSELNVSIDIPDIPALGINGGRQDLQRFIYWNFIKCFWNEDFGWDASVMGNFDWYSPSNAFRYTKTEFLDMCEESGWSNLFLHAEEACYSGRFDKG
ncbi:class I SAM-dependent methyltransferase [Opitutales bacterium]|jgi:ubiquinone/menaquinone biosynthesis C-methylase UbiE|nr:class I SAM-dependent methyltransferase [Opitutales bacterium]